MADSTQVTIYPNPTSNEFNVLVEGSADETVIVEIIDMRGTIIFREGKFRKGIVHQIGAGLASAIYLMRVIDGEDISYHKLVVTK